MDPSLSRHTFAFVDFIEKAACIIAEAGPLFEGNIPFEQTVFRKHSAWKAVNGITGCSEKIRQRDEPFLSYRLSLSMNSSVIIASAAKPNMNTLRSIQWLTTFPSVHAYSGL